MCYQITVSTFSVGVNRNENGCSNNLYFVHPRICDILTLSNDSTTYRKHFSILSKHYSLHLCCFQKQHIVICTPNNMNSLTSAVLKFTWIEKSKTFISQAYAHIRIFSYIDKKYIHIHLHIYIHKCICMYMYICMYDRHFKRHFDSLHLFKFLKKTLKEE